MVHILFATQNVTQDTLPKGTKTNIGYRVGLRTTSNQESRNIIGVGGLEDIKPEEIGKGIMRNTVFIPFKTFYITDEQIETIVKENS